MSFYLTFSPVLPDGPERTPYPWRVVIFFPGAIPSRISVFRQYSTLCCPDFPPRHEAAAIERTAWYKVSKNPDAPYIPGNKSRTLPWISVSGIQNKAFPSPDHLAHGIFHFPKTCPGDLQRIIFPVTTVEEFQGEGLLPSHLVQVGKNLL